MSNLEKLIAKGAYSCAGELLFKNKVMGKLRDGEFYISEDGMAELEIEDVEVKEVKPKVKKVKLDTPKAELSTEDELTDLLGE